MVQFSQEVLKIYQNPFKYISQLIWGFWAPPGAREQAKCKARARIGSKIALLGHVTLDRAFRAQIRRSPQEIWESDNTSEPRKVSHLRRGIPVPNR